MAATSRRPESVANRVIIFIPFCPLYRALFYDPLHPDSGELGQRVNNSIDFLQVSTPHVKNSINNRVIHLICDFLHKVFSRPPTGSLLHRHNSAIYYSRKLYQRDRACRFFADPAPGRMEGSVIAAATTADTMRAMERNLPTGTRLSVSIVLHHSSLEMLERVLRSLQRAAGVAREASRVDRVRVELVDS